MDPAMDRPIIDGSDLGLRTSAGWVYRGVDLCVPEASLACIAGPSGCGRTALLLTLAGRMKPSVGRLEVAGFPLPARMRRVRGVVSLGAMERVNELDPELTVAEHLRMQAMLSGTPGGAATRDAALARVGWDGDPRRRIGSLDAPARLLVGAAVGLLARPRILVVDDADRDLQPDQTRRVLTALNELTSDGTTVVAALTDPGLAPEGTMAAILSGSRALPARDFSEEVADAIA